MTADTHTTSQILLVCAMIMYLGGILLRLFVRFEVAHAAYPPRTYKARIDRERGEEFLAPRTHFLRFGLVGAGVATCENLDAEALSLVACPACMRRRCRVVVCRLFGRFVGLPVMGRGRFGLLLRLGRLLLGLGGAGEVDGAVYQAVVHKDDRCLARHFAGEVSGERCLCAGAYRGCSGKEKDGEKFHRIADEAVSGAGRNRGF